MSEKKTRSPPREPGDRDPSPPERAPTSNVVQLPLRRPPGDQTDRSPPPDDDPGPRAA